MKKLDRSTNKLFRYRDIRMVVDWKNKYANINMDNVGELEKLLRKRKRALIKLFLRLRFSKLPDARQELHIVEKVLQEVCFSRNTNQVRGKHYLEWHFFHCNFFIRSFKNTRRVFPTKKLDYYPLLFTDLVRAFFYICSDVVREMGLFAKDMRTISEQLPNKGWSKLVEIRLMVGLWNNHKRWYIGELI